MLININCDVTARDSSAAMFPAKNIGIKFVAIDGIIDEIKKLTKTVDGNRILMSRSGSWVICCTIVGGEDVFFGTATSNADDLMLSFGIDSDMSDKL